MHVVAVAALQHGDQRRDAASLADGALVLPILRRQLQEGAHREGQRVQLTLHCPPADAGGEQLAVRAQRRAHEGVAAVNLCRGLEQRELAPPSGGGQSALR